jgi:signal transduction histidine kinase
MTARTDFGTRQRWRLRSSRLWLLAAALGAVSVFSSASLIHDTGQRREAARLTAQSMAEHLSLLAGMRLELYAVQTFAPVTPLLLRGATLGGIGQAAVVSLVEEQREAERCQCRASLPATEYFRFDLATGTLDRAATPLGDRGTPSLSQEVLTRVARVEASRPREPGRLQDHLTVGRGLGGSAVVTMVRYDGTGAAQAVFGLVENAHTAVAQLFSIGLSRASVPRHTAGPATLDTLSLQVAAADSTILFGALAPDRPYRATLYPGGALEGLGVTVALSPQQIPHRVVIPLDQLWLLGLTLLCTIVVIVLAVGYSRRELLLARARSDFIAGVSHDLRMPLAQILLASETLTIGHARDDAERLSLSNSIVREARRLIALVENVLLWSRSGAIELRPRLRPVAVDEIFGDVAEAMQLSADDAGQSIEVQSPTMLAVLGDRQLLRQALVNLVDNSLKYGKAGQRIRLRALSQTPERVRLLVEDQGPGIPGPDRATVFEPYERLGRDQVSERTGTGLGLAVVKHIATACEGTVWLEEADGGGTRVVLEVPSAERASTTRRESNGA